MKLRVGMLGVALASIWAGPVRACGPDFPPELLSDRASTLHSLPEGGFAFEVEHLVPAPTGMLLIEHAQWLYNEQKITRETIEAGWWGSSYARINGLRDAADADAAFTASSGLPPEVRAYIAGSVAFAKGHYPDAAQRMQSVLALPADARTHYGLWAQFMLGRIALARRDGAAAITAFTALREQVAQGAEDPLGLAATSLGEEAHAQLLGGNDPAAVALYAQQAALGSIFGRNSLLQVASQAFKDPQRLDKLIADPLGQRLLTAYLFTRAEQIDNSQDAIDGNPGDAAAVAPAVQQRIGAYLAALERRGVENIAGADRLAAVAYRAGNYELAGKLAQRANTGLAFWVRAKLALHSGDAAAADAAYAQAAKAFPLDETWGAAGGYGEVTSVYVRAPDTLSPKCRVDAERGTLALSRGEYMAAMEHLYNAASRYWQDAAYVAERVLSVDELKTFVDAHVPSVPAKPDPAPGSDDPGPAYGTPVSTATSLRALLARRLLRADRRDEAPMYFDDPSLKVQAQKYVAAWHATTQGSRIEQAKAWFETARIARHDGLALLGYEFDPDYASYDGEYDLNATDGDTSAAPAVTTTAAAPAVALPARDDLKLAPKFAGPGEAARLASSRANPLQRFHYRYNAVDYAQKAADLLPRQTQAFAAVLCSATGWLLDRDPYAAQKVYARYIKQGPHVAWARTFGRACPEPNFEAAQKRVDAERNIWWKHKIKHAVPYGAIGAGILLALIVFLRRGRRRAKNF